MQLGNLPWKALMNHDFLSEVFGFGICAFLSLTRAEKKQTAPCSQSPQASDRKITERYEAGELRCSLSVFRFRFFRRLDNVLLTVSVTPGAAKSVCGSRCAADAKFILTGTRSGWVNAW